MLKGGVSSPGIALGKILLLSPEKSQDTLEVAPKGTIDEELLKFEEAVDKSRVELENIAENVGDNIGGKEREIFEAQLMILEDPMLTDQVNELIREKQPAFNALETVSKKIEEQFLLIEDETIRSRVSDVRDVTSRVKRHLQKNGSNGIEDIKEPVILITSELLPSQAAKLDKEKVLGIITEKGGINSHASIIARSMNIPAVVGVRGLTGKAAQAAFVIVDGETGKVFFDPENKIVRRYKKKKDKFDRERRKEMDSPAGGVVNTFDDVGISIFANLGQIEELKKLKLYGAEGIGVLRSEFLLMNRETLPSEEEMILGLKLILETMAPKVVTIRLLDLGADKKFPFIPFPHEANPHLGRRGIRYLLYNPRLLKVQLRAIIKADTKGNARIMLPMITNLNEGEKFYEIYNETREELQNEGFEIKGKTPIGMMIETPSSVIMLEDFIPMFDFFSIGTNDLTQYILAADRESEYVQDIYDSLNPAVLKTLKTCCQAAKKAGVEISICGEMASSIRAIPILLGMGYKQISIGVNRIPEVKNMIKKLEILKSKRLASKAVKEVSREKTEKMITRFLRKMEKTYNLKITEERILNHNSGRH